MSTASASRRMLRTAFDGLQQGPNHGSPAAQAARATHCLQYCLEHTHDCTPLLAAHQEQMSAALDLRAISCLFEHCAQCTVASTAWRFHAAPSEYRAEHVQQLVVSSVSPRGSSFWRRLASSCHSSLVISHRRRWPPFAAVIHASASRCMLTIALDGLQHGPTHGLSAGQAARVTQCAQYCFEHTHDCTTFLDAHQKQKSPRAIPCLYTCLYTCRCTCLHRCACECTQMCVHMCTQNVNTNVYAHICTRAYTYVFTHV